VHGQANGNTLLGEDVTGQPWLEDAELVGEKVLLRPVTPADVDSCFELVHGRDGIIDWLVWDGPVTRADIEPLYATWPQRDVRDKGCNYLFAIIDRSDGCYSGSISLRFGGHPFAGDLGYWLAEDRWGRGMMSEAVAMIVWLAFEHTGAVLVHAECFEGNEGSRRVLERSAFEEDSAGLRTIMKKGRERTLNFHALSLGRWAERGCPGAPIEVRVKPGGG
jgi:RimJ/RimL family protein N-acetyltransferase